MTPKGRKGTRHHTPTVRNGQRNMKPVFNLNSASESTDFEIVIDDLVAGGFDDYMADVFSNADDRHIENPAAELLAHVKDLSEYAEDFWGLNGSGFDAYTNDTVKQWAYIETAINREITAVLVRIIERN